MSSITRDEFEEQLPYAAREIESIAEELAKTYGHLPVDHREVTEFVIARLFVKMGLIPTNSTARDLMEMLDEIIEAGSNGCFTSGGSCNCGPEGCRCGPN